MSALGLKEGEVKILPYSPSWVKSFETEKKKILTLKGIKDVQHIGSTSVPGMAAKPIVDMIVGIERYADYKKLINALERIGFSYKFEPRRYQALFVKKNAHGESTHYLKILRYNGIHWKQYLHVKHVLISNKKLFGEYMRIKITSAKLHHAERKEYTKSKKEIINKIVSSNI